MILPIIRQIQTVADIITDPANPPPVELHHLDEPWQDYYRWCLEWIAADPAHLDPDELRYDLWQTYTPHSGNHTANLRLIFDAIEDPITYSSADRQLAGVEDLSWLWHGWLLRGMPSLLAAVPGVGKSYLALDLARRIITGEPFPDGSPAAAPGPVIYVDAENTPTIHKERLRPWPQSALRHLFFMFPDAHRFVINLDGVADRERLFDMTYMIRPHLVIIDSFGSCTLNGENNKEDVQRLLAYFNELAREFACALLIIHHLRKCANPGQTSFVPLTIDAIRGSSHIPAMARHLWGLQFVPAGPDPDLKAPRRLWILKTNVGSPPEPLGLDFQPHPDYPDVAQITYGDTPQPYKETSRVEQCAEWILTLLQAAGEPLKPAEIISQGEDDGYYSSLIYRARQHLNGRIADTHKPQHPRNAWTLTEWETDDDDD
jgi:hypothetical protein